MGETFVLVEWEPFCDECLASVRVERGETEVRRGIAKSKPTVKLGFHWGAFALTPIWLFSHECNLAGIGYAGLAVLARFVGVFVPAVGLLIGVALLGASIYFGTTGYDITAKQNPELTAQELRKNESGWIIAGVIALVVIPVVVLLLGYLAWYNDPYR